MLAIDRILCPVDFSECSERALDYATATTRWYGSTLTVLHVYQDLLVADMIPSLSDPPAAQIEIRATQHARIDDAIARLAQRASDAGVAVEVLVEDARDVHRAILEQARRGRADLIVMGSHGRSGFERLLLGSITEKIVRKAESPVLIVPPAAEHPVPAGDAGFDSILCAVDFSEGSRAALAYALSLAEEADADLTLLHVLEVPPEIQEPASDVPLDVDAVRAAAEARRLVELRAMVPDSAREYCHVHTAVAEGHAYREILRFAREHRSDLIVMGVQGRGAVDRLVFGSNTSQVIRSAPCPVLTAPPGATP
jgi:nucleotide-binding universal stress UspA family protein